MQAITTAAQRFAEFPAILQDETQSLNDEQWRTKTLPGIWAIKQIVHHLADSHTNGMIRRKWSHLFLHLDETQTNRSYYHPGDRATVSATEQLLMYVHHGNHYLGFIRQLIKAKSW